MGGGKAFCRLNVGKVEVSCWLLYLKKGDNIHTRLEKTNCKAINLVSQGGKYV